MKLLLMPSFRYCPKKLLASELENYLQGSETMLVDYIYSDTSVRNNTKQLVVKIKTTSPINNQAIGHRLSLKKH